MTAIDNASLMELVLTDETALAEHYRHPDWRVRYACAIGMGESGSQRWLPMLTEMLLAENDRALYTQPRVRGFVDSYDDTRMAEQLIRTRVIFDQDYPEALLEDWRCRGRVRQACLFAVHDIGVANQQIIAEAHRILDDPNEDSVVQAAGARLLARVGDAASIPHLERALAIDEWCLATEVRKALEAIRARASGHS